jgi:hypothetical protein
MRSSTRFHCPHQGNLHFWKWACSQGKVRQKTSSSLLQRQPS